MYGGVTTHPTSEKQNYLVYVSRKFSRIDTKLLETMWQYDFYPFENITSHPTTQLQNLLPYICLADSLIIFNYFHEK